MTKKVQKPTQRRHLGFASLIDHIRGRLSGAQKTRVTNHLPRCVRCRQNLEFAKALDETGSLARVKEIIKNARSKVTMKEIEEYADRLEREGLV